MNSRDKTFIHKIWEQMQQSEPDYEVELEGKMYVHSVDGTGTIGVAGKVYAPSARGLQWLTPMEVYGIEEVRGSKRKYSEKTQQLLEMFKPGSPHHGMLKARAKLIALNAVEESHIEENFYYIPSERHFVSIDSNYNGARFFNSIMKLSKL